MCEILENSFDSAIYLEDEHCTDYDNLESEKTDIFEWIDNAYSKFVVKSSFEDAFEELNLQKKTSQNSSSNKTKRRQFKKIMFLKTKTINRLKKENFVLKKFLKHNQTPHDLKRNSSESSETSEIKNYVKSFTNFFFRFLIIFIFFFYLSPIQFFRVIK
jgi:hypothetical protein